MQVLEHKWFEKANKALGELRKGSDKTGEAFSAYASSLMGQKEEDSD
jgi:hypothetical protein